MKTKLFTLLASVLMSVSLFAADSVVPSAEELGKTHDLENEVVLAMYFDVTPCNDIVLVGTYNGWAYDDVSSLIHFEALNGYDGWYVASFTWAMTDEGGYPQAKPVQLANDGSFDWRYQAGDASAWIYMGGNQADIAEGYDGECNVSYSAPGAYIYEIAYWKLQNSPCDAPEKRNYTIIFFDPVCADYPDNVPAITGDFNNWTWLSLEKTYYQDREAWTTDVSAEPGSSYKMLEATNGWDNEFEHYSADNDVWEVLPNQSFPELSGESNEYIIDYSDASEYRYKMCVQSDPMSGCPFQGECGSYGTYVTYELACDGTMTISGTGDMSNWSVGETPWADQMDHITSLVINEGVTAIGMNAFNGCTSMKAMSISSTVETIYDGAFVGCTSLEQFTCFATTPPSMNEGTFTSIDFTIPLFVPENAVADYQEAFGWGDFTNIQPYTQLDDPIGELSKIVYFINAAGWTNVIATIYLWDDGNWNLYGQGDAMEKTSEQVNGYDILATTLPEGYSDYRLTFNDSEGPDDGSHYAYDQVWTAEKPYFCVNGTYDDNGFAQGDWYASPEAYLAAIDRQSKISHALIGDLYYNLDTKSMTAEVTYQAIRTDNYAGIESLVSIPTSVEYEGASYDVVSIGDSAFYYCSGMTSIDIPIGLTSIGNQAFLYCSNLMGVYIPESVTNIGVEAFGGCSGMTTIAVSEGNSIYDSRDDCNGVIETSTNTLVVGCQATAIPSSVSAIGNAAFLSCFGLTSIDIPNSVTRIEFGAFAGCEGLTSIELPEGVTFIGDQAFSYCIKLSSIIFPESVTGIGSRVLFNSNALTSITCKATTPPSLDENAFSKVNPSISLYVPAESIEDYKAAEGWSEFTNILAIESGSGTDIPSTDFAKPYQFTGLDAILDEGTFLNANNNIEYNDREECGVVLWQINATRACEVQVTVNMATGSESGHQFKVELISADKTIVGESSETATQWDDQDVELPERILIPEPGEYTIRLSNLTSWSHAIISGLTFVSNDNNTCEPISGICGAEGENLTWTLDCEGALTITGEGAMGAWENGQSPWEQYKESITTIAFEGNVTNIANYAFNNCTNLTYMNIPSTVTSIEFFAFESCSNLESIYLGDNLRTIGSAAFQSCKKLSNVTFGNNVVTIGSSAFNGTTIDTITLPSSIVTIEEMAFAYSNLRSIFLPENVVNISPWALSDCDLMESITVDANNPYFSAIDGVLYDKEGTILIQCPTGRRGEFIIPDHVTTIGYNAFGGNLRLSAITIPNTVTAIDTFAFSSCIGLTAIEIPNSVTSMGTSIFVNCENLSNVTIGSGVTTLGESFFLWCKNLTKLTCYAEVPPTLGEDAFKGVENPITVYVPEESIEAYKAADGWSEFTIAAIGSEPVEIETEHVLIGELYYNLDVENMTAEVTYQYQESNDNYEYLTNAIIPSYIDYNDVTFSVTGIGEYAFAYCTDLLSIEIPNSITYIGNSAFYYCYRLSNIDIPNSITTIGEYAFVNCSEFTNIDLPNSLKSIAWGTFQRCTGLTSIVIPNSIEEIGGLAFMYCTNLTSIVVDENNSTFDSRDNCNAIIETESNTLIVGCQSTIIPNTVTNIGSNAFYQCTTLTDITIPVNITSIGSNAFYQCYGLTSIVVEDGNSSYDSRDNCNAIIETESNTLIVGCQSTIIPNTVTSIGKYAFYGCYMSSVNLPDSVTSIGEGAFASCRDLTSITIPKSVTRIDRDAFSWNDDLEIITCHATIPPICTGDVFSSIDKSIPLYVPEESIDAYKSADGWSEFTNIIGIDVPQERTAYWYWAGYVNGEDVYGVTEEQMFTNGKSYITADEASYIYVIHQVVGEAGLTYMAKEYSEDTHATLTTEGYEKLLIPAGGHELYLYDNGDGTVELSLEPLDGKDLIGDDLPNTDYCPINGWCGIEGDDIFWEYDCNGVLTIRGEGMMQNWSYGEQPWFSRLEAITSVVIEDGVTNIGSAAFYGCANMTTIVLPSTLTQIGIEAFVGCKSLSSITSYAVNPPTLQEGTFVAVDYYIPLYVPAESVEAYRKADYWSEFTNIRPIGDYVTYYLIGSGAALGSWDLERALPIDGDSITIALPASAYEFKILTNYQSWENALDFNQLDVSCSSEGLEAGTNDNIKFVLAEDGLVTIKVIGLNICVTGTFGGEVTATSYSVVGDGALLGVDWNPESTLTEMTLQDDGSWIYVIDSVELKEGANYQYKVTANHTWSVEQYPNDTDFYSISVEPSGVYSVVFILVPGEGATATVDLLHELVETPDCPYRGVCGDSLVWELNCDGELTISGTGDMSWEDNVPWLNVGHQITSLVLSEGITSIGAFAFGNCVNLTSVTIPNSVRVINLAAFNDCTGLESVDLGTGVDTIYDSAFLRCSNLTSIVIPESVDTIGQGAFIGCDNLTSVTINSASVIEKDGRLVYIFGFQLQEIAFGEGATRIGSYKLYYPNTVGLCKLRSITFPATVTEIGEQAFYGTHLDELYVPEQVTVIGEDAFKSVKQVWYDGPATGAPWGAQCINDRCVTYQSIDVTDNSLDEWDNLPEKYVFEAKCPADATMHGLKSMKVFADPMYINLLVEPNMDDVTDLEWVPFHVIINTDNSDETGGYGDEFTDANTDILLEGALFSENEPTRYDPLVYKWWGEVGANGWDWTDPNSEPTAENCWGAIVCEGQLPISNSQYVDGKFEIQLLRELIPADWNETEFGIGIDIQQDWMPVGILPIASPTEDNPNGYTKKLTVRICDLATFPVDTTVVEPCDTIIVQLADTITEGEVYTFGESELTEEGTYEYIFKTANDCDSTVILNLTVIPYIEPCEDITIEIVDTISAGETYLFGGRELTLDGIYIDSLRTENGCDSIVILNLTVIPVVDPCENITVEIIDSIAEGESYEFGTMTLTEEGTYIDTLKMENGCDSIVILTLTFTVPEVQETVVIINGVEIVINDSTGTGETEVDILGDSTLVYNPEENTLTISNLTLETDDSTTTAISYTGTETLTIVLNDSSTIVADTVITSTADVIITGEGTLVAEGVVPIIGVPEASILFDSVSMYVHSLSSHAAVRRRIKGIIQVDEDGGPALSGFGSVDFNKTGVTPPDALYGPVDNSAMTGIEGSMINAMYVQDWATGEINILTEIILTAIADGQSAVTTTRTSQALDPNKPMYNILGLQVGEGYTGIVIQNGQTYIVQ